MYMNQEWRFYVVTQVYANTNNLLSTCIYTKQITKNINHYNKCKNVYDPLTIKVLKET